MSINNNKIKYAMEISYDTTTNIFDIDMVNGKIKYITGRDTTGFTYENLTPASGFLTGRLIDEPIKSLGTKIDISTGGDYNTLNSCTITIDNTNNFMTRLLSNNIYLINSKIQIYVVIDNVLYNRFGGVINDIRYNEKNLVFECKDYNELIFNKLPKSTDSQVIFGDITYTKLKKETESKPISIKSYPSRYYKQTYLYGKLYPVLTILVDKEFYDQYKTKDSLANFFVRPRQFGTTQGSSSFDDAIRIVHSEEGFYREVYALDGIVVHYIIPLVLEQPFKDILSENMIGSNGFWSTDTLPNSPTLFNLDTRKLKYTFDIIDFQTKYYISSNKIESIELDSNNKPIVYVYQDNSDDNDGQNGKYIKTDAAVDYNISGLNPYIILKNNTENIKMYTYDKIKFTDCQMKWIDNVTADFDPNDSTKIKITNFADTRPWVNGSEVIDDNYSTIPNPFNVAGNPLPYRHSMTNSYDTATNAITKILLNCGVMYDMTLPDSFNFKDYDSVYLGFGITFNFFEKKLDNMKFYFGTHDIVRHYYDYNTHGNSRVDNAVTLPATNKPYIELTHDSGVMSAFVFDGMYNRYVSSGVYYATQIFSPFTDNITIGDRAKVNFSTYYNINYLDNYIAIDQKLKENMKLENDPVVSIDGKKKIIIYPRIDPYDFTAGDEYSLFYWLYDLHLIGEKEISSNELYVKIKGEVGSGNIPINNVYNTFKSLFEDYNSFINVNYTNVSGYRHTWSTARIISEPTSTKELIKDLAQQSFVGVYTNRSGNIELDAFREENTFKQTWIHNNSNIINNSILSVTSTNISKVYNDIDLQYNYDYAKQKFTKNYYVTNVDKPPFPYGSLDWSEYSNIPSITDAQAFWENGHTTWKRNKVVNKLPDNLAQCNWYRDLQEFDPNALGVLSQSVHYYLANIVEWNTRPKNMIKYSIPLNSINIKIELLDRVTFSDKLITSGSTVKGWVTSIDVDLKKSIINLEITTEPGDLVPIYKIIDEKGNFLDTIEENQTTSINIDEDFVMWVL